MAIETDDRTNLNADSAEAREWREAISSVIAFEGGDLVNWGASNAGQNRNLVTAALGFRIRIPDSPVDLGFAWEFPLTDEEQGLMKDRFTVDMVISF